MEVTEVRIFLKDASNRKLKAYATVTFDNSFVVRNMKVIEGREGLFIAMPSRKMKETCPKCGYRNELRSKFCNNCGSSLPQQPPVPGTQADMRLSEHRDLVHPITQDFREYLQKKVLEAYEQEKTKTTTGA